MTYLLGAVCLCTPTARLRSQMGVHMDGCLLNTRMAKRNAHKHRGGDSKLLIFLKKNKNKTKQAAN